jgi:hypothetical protein
MTDTPAVLACRCGACRIVLSDPRMRCRTECLCCDCRQRGLISAARGRGNALPEAVLRYERGIDLYYFANALIVDDASRALLEFAKLRADANNTTAMSACCGTLMCGIHPLYEGCSISVNADSCRVTVPEAIPNQMVVFGCDIPAESWGVRCARGDVPMVYSVADELESPPMVALVRALTTPVEPRYLGPGVTTFEALCASGPVRLDNAFFAESRAGRPRGRGDLSR